MVDESSPLPRVRPRRREEAADSFTTLRAVTKKRAMTDNGRPIGESRIKAGSEARGPTMDGLENRNSSREETNESKRLWLSARVFPRSIFPAACGFSPRPDDQAPAEDARVRLLLFPRPRWSKAREGAREKERERERIKRIPSSFLFLRRFLELVVRLVAA